MYKAVAAEKNHQNFLTGVEHFDKSSMKHTETTEKNALPPIEGLLIELLFYLNYNFVALFGVRKFSYLLSLSTNLKQYTF